MYTHSLLNVLIVDDENKACTNLRNLLNEYVEPKLNVAGIANSTAEAEGKIADLKPDAIFLDIEMPNENAFQFLERISPFSFEVIFVTAYDEYAVRAFKLNAIDYILKPISINELQNAVRKLREKLSFKSMLKAQPALYGDISAQLGNRLNSTRITLKDAGAIDVVEFKDILFIEANGSYSKVVFLKTNVVCERMMSNPLSEYEELLSPDRFYRVHRSYLVNCGRIKKMLHDGSCSVKMDNDIILPVSRRKYSPLLEFLKSAHNYND